MEIGEVFTHDQLWNAIAKAARRKGWSRSRLACLAGLDPTSLNKAKEFSSTGQPRWPSMETISKLLVATEIPLAEFCRWVEGANRDSSAEAKILLVDDDADFRDVSATFLREAGYGVHLASGHRDAFERIASAEPLDLLCTDIVMPEGLGGVALARHARIQRPELKVLYITGYDIPELKNGPKLHVLQKPTRTNALVAEVGRILAIEESTVGGPNIG